MVSPLQPCLFQQLAYNPDPHILLGVRYADVSGLVVTPLSGQGSTAGCTSGMVATNSPFLPSFCNLSPPPKIPAGVTAVCAYPLPDYSHNHGENM